MEIVFCMKDHCDEDPILHQRMSHGDELMGSSPEGAKFIIHCMLQ